MKQRVVARDSQILGTYDEDTLLALLNGGTLKLTDQYWDAKRSEWRPLMDYVGKSRFESRWNLFRIPARIRIGRLASMVVSAALGALITWAVLQPPRALTTWWRTTREAGPATEPSPAPPAPQAPPATPAESTPPPEAAPKPPPSSPSTPDLVNVEDLGDEVALTVLNRSDTRTRDIEVRLIYHELPADDLRLDKIEQAIAAAQARLKSGNEKARSIAAVSESLDRILRLVSTDVVTWTPAHLKAIPTAEQWKAFGDAELEKAGTQLADAAAIFSSHVASNDPSIRKQALTENLLALARTADDLKRVIERLLADAAASRKKQEADVRSANAELDALKARQSELRPIQDSTWAKARKKAVRAEVVRINETIEPGLVKRVTVKRDPDPRLGVIAELVARK